MKKIEFITNFREKSKKPLKIDAKNSSDLKIRSKFANIKNDDLSCNIFDKSKSVDKQRELINKIYICNIFLS